MIKKTILATALLLATTSLVQAKDTLYIVNSGSKGGTTNSQMTAWMTDLKPYYNIKYIQAKGCAKTAAIIRKLKNVPNAQSISAYGSTRNHKDKDCQQIYASKDTYLFGLKKSGMIFSLKEQTKKFLTDGATIGFNGSNDKFIAKIEAAAGIKFKTVRYETSKGVTLGVLNGEVDFGLTNSTKRFWKNESKLNGIYNLGTDEANGIPSILKDIPKAPTKTLYDNFTYYGTKKAEVKANMIEAFKKEGSAIRSWVTSSKGYQHNILNSDNDWHADFLAKFPTK